MKQQGLVFEQYKDTINQRKVDINELELTNKHLQNQVKSLAQELNKRIPEDEVDEILTVLEKEALQNTDLKQKIVTLGSEIESNKLKISRLSNKRMNGLKTRLTTVYSNINISEKSYK
ncbi:hypothetical protein [Sporolactobacillus terrae]|uniref:hypothetical protein n=1 Tax=Sporolactobacillus terrae TaxID=269673 RepID=UPI00048DE6ED|nr:hypothetical protein [Sporolactobacillus terrae]UAK16758.1 hypothetical protein K7399_01975 [Sporolactobacillus terrae]